MTQQKQVYRCNICGNIVEVLHSGRGELVCCNKPMELLEEKTRGEGQEKHIPVIEKTDERIKIKVGSIPHPMEQNHYIQWIEVNTDREAKRKFLNAGDRPEAEFCITNNTKKARIYCNVHGLWKF